MMNALKHTRAALAAALIATLGLTVTTAAHADIVPDFGDFGPLTGFGDNPFGGSGNPFDRVAITEYSPTPGGPTITLGLSAHERYEGSLPDNGNGTFYARPGFGTPPSRPDVSEAAFWNFNFFIGIDDGDLSGYNYLLEYDFDPGSSIDDFGQVRIYGSQLESIAQTGTSQNLTFNWLSGTPPLTDVTPPNGQFNPHALGTYSFRLSVFDINDASFANALASTSMNVAVVPVPPAAGLILLGMVGFGLRRQFAKK